MKPTPLARCTFAFVDVETTGLDPKYDRVVEVATLATRAGREVHRFATLVDPRIPIPSAASAIHHIVDADVRGKPTLARLAPHLRRLVDGAVVVAHNASFDLAFLPCLRDRPSLCSMRFAMRVCDDVANYRNQTLRTAFGVDDDELAAMSPHRALADVLVTARVFARLLERAEALGIRDLEALQRAIATPRLRSSFWFGMYNGAPIATIPSGYLAWIVETGFENAPDVRFTAEQELRRRHERTRPMLRLHAGAP